MRRLVLIGVCLLCGNAMAAAQDKQPEAVEIPLKEIWGFNIPGTRDAQKLDPLPPAKRFMEIRQSLWRLPPKGKQARAGFAVLGTGSEALKEVHAVLVDEKKPQATFRVGDEISIVFFANASTYYVHLDKVQRKGNSVEVRYRFVPHETADTSEHFALIPLGKLPRGKYEVKPVQAPMDRRFVGSSFPPVSEDVIKRIVSRPFSFSVAEQGE